MLIALSLAWPAAYSRAAPPNVVWQEGEDFVSSPEPVHMSREQVLPASGSALLNRGALNVKGNVVTYRVDVPVDMAGAKVVIRYARPWLRRNESDRAKLTLVGPPGRATDGQAAVEVNFKNTDGWGGRSVDYDLLTVAVGDLTKGEYSLELTALEDRSSLTIDGFFIAPGDFKISSEELDPLTRLKITSRGYVGLRRPSIVVRQDVEKHLTLSARSFDPGVKCALAGVTMKDVDGKETPLAAEEGPAEELIKLDVSALADGEYVLSVRMDHPDAELEAALLLAGKFLGSLDENIKKLEAAAADVKSSGGAAAQRCRMDLEHAAAYLQNHKSRLMVASETDESVWKASLEDFNTWVRGPEALLRNMRRTIAQSEETLRRLEAGEDPYEARFGETRRAYRSATSGKIHAYRVFVPSSYAVADKTPFILMLHGAGDDENFFPDLEGGAVLDGLEKRGYLAVMPKWHSGDVSADMPQLIGTVLEEYPKIDPQRVYCTGLSMGGFGTYRLATSHPELFAAVACAAGTGDPTLAGNLKNVPTLILQGEADPVVSPAGAERMAAKMKELHQVFELHLFPGHGHGYKLPDYLELSLDFFDKYTKKP